MSSRARPARDPTPPAQPHDAGPLANRNPRPTPAFHTHTHTHTHTHIHTRARAHTHQHHHARTNTTTTHALARRPAVAAPRDPLHYVLALSLSINASVTRLPSGAEAALADQVQGYATATAGLTRAHVSHTTIASYQVLGARLRARARRAPRRARDAWSSATGPAAPTATLVTASIVLHANVSKGRASLALNAINDLLGGASAVVFDIPPFQAALVAATLASAKSSELAAAKTLAGRVGEPSTTRAPPDAGAAPATTTAAAGTHTPGSDGGAKDDERRLTMLIIVAASVGGLAVVLSATLCYVRCRADAGPRDAKRECFFLLLPLRPGTPSPTCQRSRRTQSLRKLTALCLCCGVLPAVPLCGAGGGGTGVQRARPPLPRLRGRTHPRTRTARPWTPTTTLGVKPTRTRGQPRRSKALSA